MGRRLRDDEPRPTFRDSAGVVGIQKDAIQKFANLHKQSIQFELLNSKYIRLVIPGINPIKVGQKNAIRLAHWLLDNCK